MPTRRLIIYFRNIAVFLSLIMNSQASQALPTNQDCQIPGPGSICCAELRLLANQLPSLSVETTL